MPVNNWRYQVDLSGVFHDDVRTFAQRRDAIIRVLRASGWFKSYEEGEDLPQAVEELADTWDVGSFDIVWSAVYDIADGDRAWLKTY